MTTTVANHTNWFNYTAPALNASLTISNETKVDNGSGLHSTVFNNGTAINSTVFQNSTTINFTTVANLTANINLTDTINVTTLRQNFADVTESPVYPQTFQLWPIYLTEQPTTTVENEVEVLSTLVYFTRRHSRRTTGSSTPTTTTSPTIATTATPTVLNITSKSTAVLTPNVTSSNSSDQLVPNSQNLVETNVIVNNPDVRLNDSSYTDSATLLALEAQILAVNQQTNLSDFQPSPTVYSDSLVEPEDFVERYVTLPPPYDFVKH